MVTIKQNFRVTKQGKGETKGTVENQHFTKVDRNRKITREQHNKDKARHET